MPIVTTAHTIGVSRRAITPATAVTGIRRPRRRSVSTSPAVTAATAHCSAAATREYVAAGVAMLMHSAVTAAVAGSASCAQSTPRRRARAKAVPISRAVGIASAAV